MKIGLIKLLLLVVLFSASKVTAQTVELLASGARVSLRGLSAIDDSIIWVSGSSGTVGRSVNGGKGWQWWKVKGFDSVDFRDIEAFDHMTAVIIGVGEPAYILRTIDGGYSWKTVYTNKTKGMFLDAMEFWNDNNGAVLGDPLGNNLFYATTSDGGKSWQAQKKAFAVDSGEACFASSGTNIRKLSGGGAVCVTGGLKSSIFINGKKSLLPILQGTESTGANSIAVKNDKNFIVVGGDFTKRDLTEKNCFITLNGGKDWNIPATPPHGYRSCVEFVSGNKWITCGLNGVDISNDDGTNWKVINNGSYNVCRKAKKSNAVFFAGSTGRVGRLVEKE